MNYNVHMLVSLKFSAKLTQAYAVAMIHDELLTCFIMDHQIDMNYNLFGCLKVNTNVI